MIIGCISIYAFPSLVGIPVRITSSVLELKKCAIAAGIKNYESIIKKNKKKQDEILLLAKTKWNSMEVLISKALTDSYIRHDEFIRHAK